MTGGRIGPEGFRGGQSVQTGQTQVFWVVFCAFSIGAVMQLLRPPPIPRGFTMVPPPILPELLSPRLIGYVQLGLLCLMIFLYVGFRIYYAGKYGDWETDEE